MWHSSWHVPRSSPARRRAPVRISSTPSADSGRPRRGPFNTTNTEYVGGEDANGNTVCTEVQTGSVICGLGALAPGRVGDRVPDGHRRARRRGRNRTVEHRQEAVQAQAGHRSIESTRVYLHLTNDWLADEYLRASAAIDADQAAVAEMLAVQDAVTR